mmetsp:Transcript_29841/g.28999  ORF Transcript_29841/g.28999 Transcript_29841/m.28999 type:complete len:222 (+) Transcript_29841:589-1254(+)
MENSTLTELLIEVGEVIEETIEVIVVGNLAINFIFYAAFQMVWKLIHSMQVITHIPLLCLAFPGNFLTFTGYLIGIANFDMIPLEALKEKVFGQMKYEKFSDMFDNLGYEGTNIIDHLDTFLFIFAAILLIAPFLLLIASCKSRFKIANMIYELYHYRFFFNSTLRVFKGGFLKFCVSSLLGYYSINFNGMSDTINSIFILLLIVVVSMSPFLIFGMLVKQ